MKLTKTLFKYFQSPVFTKGLQDWKARGKCFSFTGNDIFYMDEKGEGNEKTPLVLIHGYPTNSYDWNKMWPGLKTHFNRLIAPDLFGFGFSAKPFRSYKITDQASMIESLMEHLGVSTCHILAHDYGDTVAQELLARHTDRQGGNTKTWDLKSLCFTNGGIFPETHIPLEVQRNCSKKLMGYYHAYHYFFRGGVFETLHKIFGPNTQPSEEIKYEMWCTIRANNGVRIQPHLLQYIAQRVKHRERWIGAMQKTATPLHMIHGDYDPINPPPFEQHYRKNIPNSGMTVLKGIGHWPNLEAPDLVLEAYLDFLKRL